MKYFEALVSRISLIERDIGAVFMLGVMMVIVVNVIYRALGGIIPGTYDLVELLIVPAVAFALVTVELAKRHTVVDLIVSRMGTKLRLRVELAMTLISITFWSLVCYASYGITLEKMRLGETTDTLRTSVIPFRWVWVFALAWLIVVILLNIGKLVKEMGDAR